ncbi:MAG: TIGR04283 family arsenosugar biosynthesis glycosyltransferase [Halioglobus sp.]
MSRDVSFVIPVLNEQAVVADLLRDLRQRYPHSQLIVVDGGSADQTVAMALPLCDQLLLCEPGRARQMNLGGRVASRPYLFFLHADSRPGISSSALDNCLSQHPLWGFCRVRLSGQDRMFRIIEWCMNQRSRLTHIATGDQMLFMCKELFDRTAGFDDLPLMEDVAYCKRLRRVQRPYVIQAAVWTSSRRWEEGGVMSTVLRMWCLRLGYFLGVAPGTLWRHYYGG